MKTFLVIGLLMLLVGVCIYMVAVLPMLMMLSKAGPIENTPPQPPDNVHIALGKNFSTGVRKGKDHFNEGDSLDGYLRKSNLQVDLPSGQQLFYEIGDYGSVDYENKIVAGVDFRLPNTTPKLHIAVENLKSEIRKFNPEKIQNCENDLNRIQNIESAPMVVIEEIGVCNIEIEPDIFLRTKIDKF
jgi:hypothetical protein